MYVGLNVGVDEGGSECAQHPCTLSVEGVNGVGGLTPLNINPFPVIGDVNGGVHGCVGAGMYEGVNEGIKAFSHLCGARRRVGRVVAEEVALEARGESGVEPCSLHRRRNLRARGRQPS